MEWLEYHVDDHSNFFPFLSCLHCGELHVSIMSGHDELPDLPCREFSEFKVSVCLSRHALLS